MPTVQTSLNLDEPRTVEASGAHNPYEHNEVWDKCAQTRDKDLGQVSTPRVIAEIMARWVTERSPKSVMDPAAGLGNLLLECKQQIAPLELLGVEKDLDTLEQARRTAPAGTRLIVGDYLKMQFSPQEAIIANPPYVKAHFLPYGKAEWRAFEESFGLKLDGLTNLYALFLLKIFEDLKEFGRAAVIIPAEFLNANFGRSIKQHLLTRIKPLAIAVFDPNVQVFDSALTTSCIVFIEKGAVTNPRLYTIKSVEDLAGVVRSFSNPAVNHWIDASRLSPEEKWLNLLFSPVSQKTASRLPAKIADYFKCRRGIATGANDYFCLSVDEIKRFGLDERDFDPCITKATHAEGLVFAKTDFDRLSLSGKKCYLLNVKGKKSAELEAYLRQGELEGVPIRHLPAHRPIWYQPEPREVADIWAAVFSRERPKFVLNTARVKNLTCYHGLYSRRNCWKDAVLLTIFLNTSIALEAFAGINRFYGGGLKKVEPKDVESMPCPKLPKISDAEAARLLSAIESINGQSDVDVTKPLDKIGRELFT